MDSAIKVFNDSNSGQYRLHLKRFVPKSGAKQAQGSKLLEFADDTRSKRKFRINWKE